MYKTIEEAKKFVVTLAPLMEGSQAEVWLAVPFTALYALAALIQEKSIAIEVGAQNIFDASEGAYTGEIAAKMVKEAGGSFVILGHSERRHLFHESDAFVNRKVKRALEEGLRPLLCVGETETQRANGETEKVLEEQLLKSLEGVNDLEKLVLAYEPVWAIGTGKRAAVEDAISAHAFCRKVIGNKWGKEVATSLVIQYGGSVKPENAKELLEAEGVDGLLVGGASLSPASFSEIIKCVSL